MTIWKTINGYPDYAISNDGQVKSLRFDRILKASASNHNYLYVNLLHNRLKKTRAVHRLVMEHFGPTCPVQNMIVDHIDGNKHNNHNENLQWMSIVENTLKSYGNAENKEKILELRKTGVRYTDISRQLNLNMNLVRDTCIKAGL
jgi:hypothetical protein